MAENLWALREQKHVSVATLASRAGLAVGVLLEYESGRRAVDPKHLPRIARALYVEESEIRLVSEPNPRMTASERPDGVKAEPPRPVRRAGGGRFSRLKPVVPARESQLETIAELLERLGREPDDVAAELGKPLAELDRTAASQLLRRLQRELPAVNPDRRRPYLPEAVGEYETRYLQRHLEQGSRLHFRLFDGATAEGQLAGFGPYSITLRQANGDELTLNKLAIMSYTAVKESMP